MPDIEFPTDEGTGTGYLALPDDESGRGVVVLQERWDVDDHIRSVCDRLAREGFVTVAPDFQHPEGTGPHPSVGATLEGAVAFVLGHEVTWGEQIGLVGFSYGGGLALWAASTKSNIAGAVAFYPVMNDISVELWNVQCPILAHIGNADAAVPSAATDELQTAFEDAGVPANLAYYDDAGHSFFNDADPGYDPRAAQAAWGRTVAFLNDSLGSTPE